MLSQQCMVALEKQNTMLLRTYQLLLSHYLLPQYYTQKLDACECIVAEYNHELKPGLFHFMR